MQRPRVGEGLREQRRPPRRRPGDGAPVMAGEERGEAAPVRQPDGELESGESDQHQRDGDPAPQHRPRVENGPHRPAEIQEPGGGPDGERLGDEQRPRRGRARQPRHRDGDGDEGRIEGQPDRLEEDRDQIHEADEPRWHGKDAEAPRIEKLRALHRRRQRQPDAADEHHRQPGGEERQWPASLHEPFGLLAQLVGRRENQRADGQAEERRRRPRHGRDQDPSPLPLAHQPPVPEREAQPEERARLIEGGDHERKERERVPPRPSPTRATKASVSVWAAGTACTTSASEPCATSRPRWMMPT